MKSVNILRIHLAFLVVAMMLMAAGQAAAQGNSGGKAKPKKEEKKLEKEAKKVGNAAEEAAEGIGHNAVFCVLAAHTDIEAFQSAQALKDKFDSLGEFGFGPFVAAVLLADRIDKSLDEILDALKAGGSIGKLTHEAGVNMGQLRKEFNRFRKTLGNSMTHPPTRDCFAAQP